MPKAVKGTPEQREQYMAGIFRAFYEKPENAGKDLSVEKANKKMIEHYGSMLRNKRAYAIRATVKGQVLHGRKGGEQVTKAARNGADVVPAGSARAAALVEGSPEQIAWLDTVLVQLNGAGLAQATVDHRTEKYAVVVRS